MKPERWARIEQVYHSAMEREPAERAAFLDEACAGDDDLRREVAGLLAHDQLEGNFIKAPAIEIAARALAAEPAPEFQPGAQPAPPAPPRIGVYQLLDPLGRGGMGEVHLALDTRLRRKVAIKLLPIEFTTDAGRVRRFEQEAHAASALNHPNIITVHEIGETPIEDGNRRYIVTEYIEGQTLRQQMAGSPQGRIDLSEAIDVASQIAAALSVAHEAGITHRDIKPENVMVRGDRLVKVLDFGLAKLTDQSAGVEPDSAAVNHSTASGVIMGTPRYMSPEQARGEKVDARADIFSLGVMLYEMVAGRAPFVGATVGEVIAAILRDAPPPLHECVPDAPPELERIIGRALEKERAERYQTAVDLLWDLKEAQHLIELETKIGATAFRVPPTGGGHRYSSRPAEVGTLSARRRRVTVLAIAALAIAAIAGLSVWIYSNRRPALTEKDTILLADFENGTGEEIFDKMLKQGLAIQLEQSPFLNLFPEAQMRHELRLMKRSPNERVTAEVAREICQRQNLKAFIAGSLAPLGSHYVIMLEAVNGLSGEPLANEQAQVESKEQVLGALSQAARRLRERLGESLSSIQDFDRPLQEGTTARLEAFKAYSQATELAVSGQFREAIPFYELAIEIDPDFAHAYNQLAIMYGATGRQGLAAEYVKKSYELKDRAGDLEKSRITYKYYRTVIGDLNKAVEVLRLQRRTYPREWTAPQDLASVYNLLGQSDQAVAEARESIRLNPNFAAPYKSLAQALIGLNRFAEAGDVLTQAPQQNVQLPDMHLYRYQLAIINGDEAGIRRQLDLARRRPDEYAAFHWQADAAAFAGQWRQAQEFSRRAIDLAVVETQDAAALYATEQALRGGALGDCRQARASAAQGLKLARGRPSLARAALALALCGETTQAKTLADELGKSYPEDTLINSIWLPSIRAAVVLKRGGSIQAIEQLQPASRLEAAAGFWPQYLRGQAYLKSGRNAEAATEFKKILSARGQGPLSVLYPLAHLSLARAATMSGDAVMARKAYDDFSLLWQNADADLPAVIEAKKQYHRAQ